MDHAAITQLQTIPLPLDEPRIRPLRTRRISGWFILGLLFLGGAITFLERRQPYYFTQDDALVAELPGVVSGCRSVWNGIWPDYDPSRLMGGPFAGAGLFSLTYPPTYLSYAIARHVLRNEFATLEVFAALHLFAGYWATYWLMRRRDVRPMIACCAALSFILSGSILIMGRSWHAYMPVVVWMPLLMASVDRLAERRVGFGWAIGTGAIAGLLFHVGFPQLWVYAMLLVAFAVLWLFAMGRIDWTRVVSAMSAGVIALGFAAPLLVPELTAARGVTRPPVYGDGLTWHWIAALLPYPLVKVPHPMGWGSSDVQFMGHFVYFGSVFAVLFLIGLVVVFFKRPLRQSLGDNVWLICAVIALLLTMGEYGGLFYVLSKIPLVQMVNNNPFRALPFFVLFAVVGAAAFAEQWLQSRPSGGRGPMWIAVVSLALLGYHVCMARPSFYTYGFAPYPPVAPAILKHLQGKTSARMMSWTPRRTISPDLASALPHNLPMLYDTAAFSGYDPLMEYGTAWQQANKLLEANPLEAARAYGLRWHLISTLIGKPVLSPNLDQNEMEQSVKSGPVLHDLKPSLTIVNHLDGVRLGELSDVAAMAFPEDKPGTPLSILADGHGITVNIAHWHSGGKLVVNYLWYPQLHAKVDGKRAAITHDRWQRILVTVPANAKTVEITYSAGWRQGIAIGAVLIAIGALGSKLPRKRPQ